MAVVRAGARARVYVSCAGTNPYDGEEYLVICRPTNLHEGGYEREKRERFTTTVSCRSRELHEQFAFRAVLIAAVRYATKKTGQFK